MMRTRDFWLGASALLAFLLVVGLLLVRVHLGRDDAQGRVLTTWGSYTVHGDMLRVDFEGSPCDTGGAEVDEDKDRVVVTAYVDATEQVCVQTVTRHPAEVRLKSPLGARAVYDGGCLKQTGTVDDPQCRRGPAS